MMVDPPVDDAVLDVLRVGETVLRRTKTLTAQPRCLVARDQNRRVDGPLDLVGHEHDDGPPQLNARHSPESEGWVSNALT